MVEFRSVTGGFGQDTRRIGLEDPAVRNRGKDLPSAAQFRSQLLSQRRCIPAWTGRQEMRSDLKRPAAAGRNRAPDEPEGEPNECSTDSEHHDGADEERWR